MSRRLSSSLTVFYKRVFPSLWFVGMGVAAVCFWLGYLPSSSGAPPPQDTRWMMMGVWLVGSVAVGHFARRVKEVRVEGDHLVVSDLREQERVPLADVEDVTDMRFRNPRTIRIHLRRSCRWGDDVVFVAPLRFQSIFSRHPVVEELSMLARRARGEALAG